MKFFSIKEWLPNMVNTNPKGLPFIFVHIHTWASPAHDEKSMFLIILEPFLSFSTMQTHAQAFICWSKYTTTYRTGVFERINLNRQYKCSKFKVQGLRFKIFYADMMWPLFDIFLHNEMPYIVGSRGVDS